MDCPRRLNSLHLVQSSDAGTSLPGCLIVLIGFALAAGCGGTTTPPPPPVPVATLTMSYKPAALTQQYPAQLEASNTVEIRPQVGGILYRQDAVEGTKVSPGQTLFEIDPRSYDAALLQTQAALAQAHAQQMEAERDLARALAHGD